MDLLLLYFFAAVIISFICSILESVLLSVNMAYISVLEKERPTAGALLKSHKIGINKSIASILILNTVANTLGAAAVGAQAESIYGHGAVFYVSIVLTFAILFFSEIIPKTIGAVYWKSLAPAAAYVIRFFIWLTYPIILMTLFVTNRISKEDDLMSLSKAELIESTLLSEDEGVLGEKESDVIENILLLDKIRIKEILTPRTVVFGLDGNRTIKDIVENESAIFKFSRVPVFDESIENTTGIVMTKKIFQQALKDDSVVLNSIKKDIDYYNSSGGGLTISGGEPTLNFDFSLNLLKGAKELGINTNIETNGYFNWNKFKELLPFLDLIYCDIKIIDADKNKEILKGNSPKMIENIKRLSEIDVPVEFRIPLIPTFTSTDENLNDIINLLKTLSIKKIHLLPYHNMGEAKADKINNKLHKLELNYLSQDDLNNIKILFNNAGIKVKLNN